MFSEADRARIRFHLGYMTVRVATGFAFGIPQLTDTQFMVEDAMTRVLPESEPRIVCYLDRLDKIECKIFGATDDLFARKIDQVEYNLEQPDMLEREYVRWASRIADMLGVMAYPFSKRFRDVMNAGRVMNVSVRG